MATVTAPRPSEVMKARPVTPPVRVTRRDRFARSERAMLVGGTTLVAVHLLESALSGPQTTPLSVVLIVAAPVVAAALQPRVTRLSRFAVALPLGLLFAITGALSYGLDVFTSGPRWADVSGLAMMIGGLLLVGGGVAATLAPRPMRPPRPTSLRLAHAAAWTVGAVCVAQLVLLPIVTGVVTTHAIRLPVESSALDVPHRTVRIPGPDGDIAAWYVPARNGAAVVVAHGSGSSRADVARQAELVARRGFGVLLIDLPGHGESDGRANLLGYGTQPAIRAAVDWLSRRAGVRRIGAFGMSLGGEVLLEAAARDSRFVAVVSDGAERAADDRTLGVDSGLARAVGWLGLQAARGISGTRPSPPLLDLVGAIAPRPVLLIAAGGRPDEIPVNRAYREAAGPAATLWAIPEAGHTRGVTARPAEYERRVVAFLEEALVEAERPVR